MNRQRSASPLVTASELLELAAVDASLRLIDARAGGRNDYLERRLEGALYADLDEDLAAVVEDPAEGGRHPLPDRIHWIATLARLAITPETRVVVYDAHGGALAAARLWWMLRASGHERAAVLDGGIAAAIAEGFPTSSGPPPQPPDSPNVQPYPFSGWQLPIVDLAAVQRAIDDGRTVLDVRSAERFRGGDDPFEPTAGHIPGARNVPYSENLDDTGSMRSADQIRALYADLQADDIVHCGSGVTACHTLLALASANLELPSLYVGSWSEWSRRDLPVATGD